MPTRTRHGFTRCFDCRRHVHAPGAPAEFVCPFCSERPRGGARTRTALLAGALALAGCGASDTEPNQTPAAETPVNESPGESPRYEEADDPIAADVYGAPPEEALDDTPDETQSDETQPEE